MDLVSAYIFEAGPIRTQAVQLSRRPDFPAAAVVHFLETDWNHPVILKQIDVPGGHVTAAVARRFRQPGGDKNFLKFRQEYKDGFPAVIGVD
ncbi:MAG TPA: hypothetical protein VN836_00310 [Verrucomicrobiae bacterium]|nr:hypothetical protein [Verrucomicrobiae bacterium]